MWRGTGTGTTFAIDECSDLALYGASEEKYKWTQRVAGILTKEGAMGLGTSDLPRWHKRKGEHILRKVDVKPKYYESEKESEQAVQYVREACESLTGKFTPSDISEWIKENKGVEIRPEGVGLYLRRSDYITENRSIDGKQMRIVKKIENCVLMSYLYIYRFFLHLLVSLLYLKRLAVLLSSLLSSQGT